VPTIQLRIDPVLCGPVSVGTVSVIKLLRDRLGLSLADAKKYIDRCVFDGETVTIHVESVEAAENLARDLVATSAPAKIYADLDPASETS
jgi:ribosomal protein L7/L12